MTPLLATTLSLARRLCFHPFIPFFGIVGLCLTAEENYPLSHFPMYGKHLSEISFYYLARDGQPLGTSLVSRFSTTKIKKMMTKAMSDAKAERQARGEPKDWDLTQAEGARKVLERMKADGLHEVNAPNTPLRRPIALMTVKVIYDDQQQKITREERELVRDE